MADQTPNNRIKLSPEMIERLKGLDENIAEAERGTKALKRLGIDTKEIDANIKWAKSVKETLLEEFS